MKERLDSRPLRCRPGLTIKQGRQVFRTEAHPRKQQFHIPDMALHTSPNRVGPDAQLFIGSIRMLLCQCLGHICNGVRGRGKLGHPGRPASRVHGTRQSSLATLQRPDSTAFWSPCALAAGLESWSTRRATTAGHRPCPQRDCRRRSTVESTRGTRCSEPINVLRDCRYPRTRHTSDSADGGCACRTSCKSVRDTARRRLMVVSVASSRSLASSVPTNQSRGRPGSKAKRVRHWSATSDGRRRASDPPESYPVARHDLPETQTFQRTAKSAAQSI